LNYELLIISSNNKTISLIAGKMEPVSNREFLLDYINHNRINSRNIINDYNDYNMLNILVRNRAERENIDLIHNIYRNHLINNYIYNHGQAGAAAAEVVEPVTVASASSTFEKFNIDVEHHVVVVVSPSQAQASSQNCHGHGDDSNACCSICLNAEQEAEQEEMVKTKCAHIFHSKCLAKWVIQKTTCPMCRNSLTKKIT
jgi:hypothetical protein